MYDIAVTGYAGLSGSSIIFSDSGYRRKLLEIYPESFFEPLLKRESRCSLKDKIEEVLKGSSDMSGPGTGPYDKEEDGEVLDAGFGMMEQQAFIRAEEALRQETDIHDMLLGHREAGLLYAASGGGIYKALWELLHRQRLGASFSQKDIPVRQQTVEICETFDLDPYRLYADGMLLWLTNEGQRLKELWEAAFGGGSAALIGHTKPGPAIERRDGESIAYLRRPEPDQLYILGGGYHVG